MPSGLKVQPGSGAARAAQTRRSIGVAVGDNDTRNRAITVLVTPLSFLGNKLWSFKG